MTSLAEHVAANRVVPEDDDRALIPEGIREGVTASWLAQAFNLSLDLVRYRLQKCPIKATKARGRKQVSTLYDLPTAARYLVSAQVSTKDFMVALRKNELPPALQVQVWEAMLKRQKVEENAGDLWRTEKVQAVLGATFQSLKFNIQLWSDTVERQVGLTEEQRVLITELGDQLQKEVYESLVENVKHTHTGSQIEDIALIVGEEETTDEILHLEPSIPPDEMAAISDLI